MANTDGFVRLPNWLIDDSDLTLQELAVYIVLLRFRDHKTGKCFPGMATIADCARVSRETVKRIIPKLEAKGMIKVTKRKQGTKNLPNLYEVALAAETPEFIWTISQRGRRIPKRTPRRPETPSTEGEEGSRHSETPPRHSETPGVGTPSASNKTHKNKTYGQASTPTFVESGCVQDQFTFDGEKDQATDKQVAYLKDLAIHLGYQTGGGVPDEVQMQRWRKFTRDEATQQIRGYLKALGRPDEIYYPQAGDPEYAALSSAGKEFAESAGMPDSVFEYGFRLKENTA